jgi:hypothetical protein
MFSRDRNEPDDPKFVHEVATRIIARAHARFNVVSGSRKTDRNCTDAARNATRFCSKLEALSSLLQTPSSIIDSDLKPAMERIQRKISQLNQRQLTASSSSLMGGNKPPSNNPTVSSLDDVELKRLAISEMTKIPVKVLEKRLPGLGERLTRHLSPERLNSPSGRDDAVHVELSSTCASTTFKQEHSARDHFTHISPINHRSTQNSMLRNSIACLESNVINKNWVSGSLATCAAAMMAIVFCGRIKNVILPHCLSRSQAATSIQRAYLNHFYSNLYGSRKKRAAFFILVKRLRKLVRNWRLRKKTRMIHSVKLFLVSMRLRAKFVRAVKQKFSMVSVIF